MIFTVVITVNAISSPCISIACKFRAVFQGLGKLKNFQLKLNIDPSVTRVSQNLHCILFHVRKKDIKLKKLLDLDLEPVTEPTPWVSPLIAVPRNNDIH